MGSALAKLALKLRPLGHFILEWLYAKLTRAISQWWAARKAKAEIEKKNKALREQLEKAQTKEEVKDAADKILGDF